jgi:phospholipid transport system substrate-binding protein
VTTRVTSPQIEPATLQWVIHRSPFTEDVRLIDVVVEGVSMLATRRSEFTSLIQNNQGEVSALNDRLAQMVPDDRDQLLSEAQETQDEGDMQLFD